MAGNGAAASLQRVFRARRFPTTIAWLPHARYLHPRGLHAAARARQSPRETPPHDLGRPEALQRDGSQGRTENRLLKLIQDHIKSSGPMPVSLYQSLCLSHPTLGYYAHQRPDASDPFGAKGDFVTSPEVSQVFGEIMAVWFVSRWQAAGCPERTRIVELGPGRGTLMADMIRTFSSLASFAPTLRSVHLVENSELMKTLQSQKLLTEMKLRQRDCSVEWYDRLEDVPRDPETWTMVVAHEFFDALPIHMFENTPQGFREVLIDLDDRDPNAPSRAPLLRMVLARSPTLASTLFAPPRGGQRSAADPGAPGPLADPARRYADVPVGSRVEVSPAAMAVAEQLGRLVGGAGPGGAALIVDYGDDHWFTRSLRGFRKHELVDPLTDPGFTDITANVDFSALRNALSPYGRTVGPTTQHLFLTRMGLPLRLQILEQHAASEDRRRAIAQAGQRLTSLVGMGKEYKVLGFESRQEGVEEQAGAAVFPFSAS